MRNYAIIIAAITLAINSVASDAQKALTATELAMDMYNACLKDFSLNCVKPKAMQWFNNAIKQNEQSLTENLSIIRTGTPRQQQRALNAGEQMFDDIDSYLSTHALEIKAPEYFSTTEARELVPNYFLDNALTKGGLVPLADVNEGRGMIRKAVLPFLLGLKLKTTVLVPLALALIALKTWKAMTLGLLSLVLSGALVIFKIAKPKIVNYEVVHYPPHVEHIERVPHIVPHHIEHIVPHHLDHHVDHHLDLHNHVEHVDHIEHPAPAWEPHPWARSSQEPEDAQNMAYAAQRKR